MTVQEDALPEVRKDYPPYGAAPLAGNHSDDDAAVLDDMLNSNAEPKLPAPNAPGEIRPGPPLAPTRILTGTATLTDTGVPQKLLNFDPNRIDLSVWISPAETTQTDNQSFTATGAPVADPGAFTFLAGTAALPQGWYDVVVTGITYGSTDASDNNNIYFAVGSNTVYTLPMNSGSAGTMHTTAPIRVYVDGTQTLGVGTIGAANAGTFYIGSLIATRVADMPTLVGYTPLLLASDVASLASPSVSSVVNLADPPGVIRLECHCGELWATLPYGSVIPSAKISWMATTK